MHESGLALMPICAKVALDTAYADLAKRLLIEWLTSSNNPARQK
jgi:hypothetical protein